MNNTLLESAFSPFTLKILELRNRFIKTATYEGYCKNGKPTQELTDFHSSFAKGDVALITTAYGAVNEDGLTHENQMVIDENAVPYLEELADKMHSEGAAISLQLTHCGFFTKSTRFQSKRPLAPSMVLNKYGLLRGRGISKAMSERDMIQTRKDFVRAAVLVKQAGFDAIELHLGHGYLLSQFLTPAVNKRKDQYGGSIKKRLRFPLEILKDIINTLGDDFPVLCKMNLSDDFNNGITIDDSIIIAQELEKAGAAALILSGGYTSRTPFFLMRGDVPLWSMVKAESNFLQKIVMALFGRAIIGKYEFTENFFLPLAKKVREQVKLPLVYVGGIMSSKGIEEIMREGFDLIAIGRALIHDPDFIKKVQDDNEHISPCNHCNICIAEMEKNGVICVLEKPET